MTTPPPPLLEVAHLSHQYQGAPEPALSDVSLSVQRGQILGLLGPNGAGKTTLISHLAAGLPVQSGAVSIDGEPFAQVHARTPTRVSVAPQEYAFYPMLTVLENLRCFAAACRLPKDLSRSRIEACLAFSQLGQFQRTRAEHLSGGLKRRLNLAIATLPQPDLYLFDEPTVGVDPQSRAFILDAIKGLAQQGAGVIYTTHYMEEIEAVADTVVILDRGRVLRQDTLENLLRMEAVRVRFSWAGEMPLALATALEALGALTRRGEAFELRLFAPTKLSAVFAELESSGLAVGDLRVGRATLEDVFLSLTHRTLRDG